MKTINKIIIAAVILLGLACCSGNDPKIIKTEEYQDNWDKNLRIRATYEDSTVVVFALRSNNSQEVVVSSIEQLNPKGTVIIPEKITSNKVPYSVTSIDEEAFSGNDVRDVTIPNTITDIADGAFEGCERLVSINIPNSVTSIGEEAFHGCERLTSITIPNSVTRIENRAFSGCSSLTSITIPGSVTKIGRYAFDDCERLTSISISDGVKEIGNGAFAGTGLKSIIIPASVTDFGNNDIFYGCIDLNEIVVMDGNMKYDSRNNCNAVIETATNTLLAGCSNTVIPNSITTIADAFSGCKGLKSITIPNNVTTIGDHAFSSCINLISVTISNNVTNIGEEAFKGCTALSSIALPNSVTNIGKRAFEECSSLTSVTIPNSMTIIEDYAFSSCSGLTSISIPNSVTTIGDYAFAFCTNLTSITIPTSVTRIGTRAFWSCTELTNVIIQTPSLSFEFDDVFYECNQLHSWDVVSQLDVNSIADGLTNEYEWILGEWKGVDFKGDLAIITREGIVFNNAVRSGMLDEVEPDRSQLTKQAYEIKKTEYDFDNKEYMSIVVNGDSAYFRDGEAAYFLDLKSKVIFYFYDFDQKITLKKVK